MRDDDREDPFDEFFREIERMMNDVVGAEFEGEDPTGFATDTHVDVYEDGDVVRVVADLPGVEKEHLTLKCDGEVLTISAASDHREYDERIRLPVRVDEDAASATFNNGILEVTFPAADDSADITLE
ncbi:MAG: Hsp20/alpha crystallin family protein [Halobacteriaceae archaeon]